MKQCRCCGQFKTDSDFYMSNVDKELGIVKIQSVCKECHRKREMDRYYVKQQFIDSKKVPCLKCGEKRIRCISFHHVDPKEKDFTIGKIRKSNLEVINNEISKCICLCLNCHHEFHYLSDSEGITLEDYLK